MTGRARLRANETGAATTELVLLTPALITVLLFVIALGRVTSARQDVDAAARDAARAAANTRSAQAAERAGDDAARAALVEGGVECRTLAVDVDTAGFRAGGTVRASVSCTVEFGDLAGVALPLSRTITSTFAAPIDRYRGTQ